MQTRLRPWLHALLPASPRVWIFGLGLLALTALGACTGPGLEPPKSSDHSVDGGNQSKAGDGREPTSSGSGGARGQSTGGTAAAGTGGTGVAKDAGAVPLDASVDGGSPDDDAGALH